MVDSHDTAPEVDPVNPLLEELTDGLAVQGISPVSGGDIAQAFRVDTAGGPVFCKVKAGATPDMFRREAAGLRLLRQHAPLQLSVPEVLNVTDGGLALEWIEPGSPTASTEAELGAGLALLHQVSNPTFGTIDDARAGYLGSVQVDLTPTGSWPAFLMDRRIRPLTERAVELGRLDPSSRGLVERLANRAAELCGPPEPPSLLHGDLWAGNRLVDRTGSSWLIDPACHWGHREIDLAMMQLFGGFGDACFRTYNEAYPLADGWRDRVEWNQLPPLLVHAVLFGGGYGQRVMEIMRRHT